uniref:DUF3741 domain-containing protein n=1 Tax=Kalanchoe fedtschenkoi TaxID=63787 RepID=A0A7N0T6N6_KALFE
MNRPQPQRPHRPADTPSGCFSALLRCLLCDQTLAATRLSTSTLAPPHRSTRFVDLLLDRDPVVGIDDKPGPPGGDQPQLPIVARLMGLDTLPDMTWVPNVARGSFGRSKSVNSVDYLLRFNPGNKSSSLHRRANTSLSFREVPDHHHFLVLRLENSKPKTSARMKNEEKSRAGNKKTRNTEQNYGQVKMRTPRRVAGKDSASQSPASSDWKQKSDYYYYYYRKPQAKKRPSKATCHKEVKLSSSSRPTQPEEANMRNTARPVSDQWSLTQRSPRRRASDSAAVSGSSRPQGEEKRRSNRKLSKVEDQSSESHGEMMMKRIKWLVEQDLEMKRWNCKNKEDVFLCRDDPRLGMETGILDELVTQIVHDLASCDM